MQNQTLILLAALILPILLYLCLRQPYRDFIRKRRYEKIVQALHHSFALIDPFLLSQTERKQSQQTDLYYGEMDICAFLDLLEITAPEKNMVFYDLGAGCGKLVLAAKLRYPDIQANGIELLESLHEMSALKSAEMHAKVNFIRDDFMNCNITHADIVFINATGFTSESFQPVLQKLRSLKPGAKVIITSKRLPETDFLALYQSMEKTSWGMTSTFIYERANVE